MKHDDLRSIGHNIADSLASGIGLLIGVYEMDIFGEAQKNPAGSITVDFLKGIAISGSASPSLTKALNLYRDALPALCETQGASVSFLRELTAIFITDAHGRHVFVTVEDHNGRRSTDEYTGRPLKRVKVLDSLGRVRPKKNKS